MKDFKKLKIWELGMKIAKEVLDLSDVLKNKHRYGIADQIARSSVSVPSNIAEGSSRRSEREKYRYMEIALGSAFELETQLLLLKPEDFPDEINRVEFLNMVVEEQKMVHGMMRSFSP